MKSGPSHRTLGSHGSPQCPFFWWSGTYNGVIIFWLGASTIGSYSSSIDVSGDMVMLLVSSIICVVSDSTLETVSTCGVPLPLCSQTGGVVIGWLALMVCGLLAMVLVVVDSYRITNSGILLALSSSLSLS